MKIRIFAFTILTLVCISCGRKSQTVFPTGWPVLGEPYDSLTLKLELGLVGNMSVDSIQILTDEFCSNAAKPDAPADAAARSHYWKARLAGRKGDKEAKEREFNLALSSAKDEEADYLAHRIKWVREDMDMYSRIDWYRHLTEELEYYRSRKDSVMLYARNIDMFNLMLDVGFRQRALSYLEEADKCSDVIGRYIHYPGARINRACVLYNVGETTQAGEIFRSLLTDSAAMADEAVSSLVYYNLYRIYNDTLALQSADSIIHQHDYNNIMGLVTASRIEVEISRSNAAEAESLAMLAEPLSHLAGQSEHHLYILKMIASAYEMSGNTDRSIIAHRAYANAADSIIKTMRDNEIVNQETQALINEADMQLQQKQEEHRRFIQWLIIAISVTVIVACVFAYHKWRTLTSRRKEAEQQRALSQQKELAMQIASDRKEQIIATTIENLLSAESDTTVQSSETRKLINMLREIRTDDVCTDSFQQLFSAMRPEFITNLLAQAPQLSDAAIRLACYSVIGLDTKEIASAMNVRPESVKQARWRLRKALNLPSGTDLRQYLLTLLNQ